MRKFFLMLLASVICLNSMAQGINFSTLGYKQALEQAKKDNKIIFIDFYTDWCAPCKGMARNIFTQKAVGDFYNANFVNLKLNAETVGREVALKYGVSAYPTLLFVNSDGDIVLKEVGAANAETFLSYGDKAKKEANNPESYLNMKKAYPQNRDNEKFLAKYIVKKVENSEPAIIEIEDFLKVQKSIKENGVDMLEFLLAYKKEFVVGGEVERILRTNYDELFSIATRREERTLQNMFTDMVYNTRNFAIKTKNVELFKTFISKWNTLKEKRGVAEEYNLELLSLEGKNKEYKLEAEKYLTSLMNSMTLDEIRKTDAEVYAEVAEKYKGRRGIIPDAIVNGSRHLIAGGQITSILKIGREYVAKIEKKKEYKKLLVWVAYAENLLPEDFRAKDFHAQILYKMGKRKEAIALRKDVLNTMDKKDKAYNIIENTLKEWEKSSK